MRVFLSYRREDSAAHAGRLADSLRRRLGRSEVFLDVTGILPGAEFDRAIDEALDRSDAVLVIIGPRWLAAAGAEGRPRLADPQDYVRREVVGALDRSLRVVPVLVGGAALPRAEDLPAGLEPLAHRQAVSLDDATWQRDVDALVAVLQGRSTEPTHRRPWVLIGVGALLGAVAATVAVLALLRDGDGDDTATLPTCVDPDESWTRLLGPDATASAVVDQGDVGTLDFTVTDVFAQDREDGTWEVVVTSVLTNNLTEGRSHGDWIYEQLEVDRQPFEEKSCYSVSAEDPEPGQRSRARVGFVVEDDPALGLRLVVGDSNYNDDFTLSTAVAGQDATPAG